MVFPLISPDLGKLRMLAEKIQDRFGLDLLGIDVIIENRTGHYAIIDINTFPGIKHFSFLLVPLLAFLSINDFVCVSQCVYNYNISRHLV